jgi:penicillin-insensitive murein endopeptidase
MRRLAIAAALLAACGQTAESSMPAPEAADGANANAPAPPIEEDPQPEPEDEPEPPPAPDPLTLGPDASLSVGSPTEGRLETSVALPLEGKGFRFNPNRNPDRRHGTVEMVQALVRAAGVVDEAVPGGVLTFGDLSMPQGGPIGGHASHRAGRDVDVMFYLLDDDSGEPMASQMIPLEPDGTGIDFKDLTTGEDDVKVRLDVPRTWKFMEALVSDPNAHINRIFVVEHVRGMLLAHAKKVRAPKAARQRFADLTCQPSFPHDDHAHIRFFCSPDDIKAGCLDTRPIFPWHEQVLAKARVQAKIAGPRTTKRPKLTSVDDAAKKAKEKLGAFHPDVDAFLERRKAWAKKPHPGRKYCK